MPAGFDRTDALLVVALVVAAFVVHPVGLMMRRPYWVDEAWVADLTRLPFARALSLSSSTPVGWLTLLRSIPGDALQRGRVLTLVFTLLSTAAAYVLARGLMWRTRGAARVAGVVVAVGVSFIPIAIERNDLKQYTADAFFALTLLAVTRAVDSSPHARSVVWLGVVAVVAVLFSSTSAFVSVACFAALLATSLAQGNADRVRTTLIAGGVAALGLACVFVLTVLPHGNSALTAFWHKAYLTGDPLRMLGRSWSRLNHLSGILAMPSAVFIVLFGLGVVALARLRATAVAIALPLLWLEMVVAARFEKYPFLDQRTFYFVLIPTVAVIAIGVVWALLQLGRRSHVAGLMGALGATVLFAFGVAPHWREFGMPDGAEDVRTQVAYVAREATPTDVILVNSSGNWGFAYYWPRGPVFATRDDSVANGFVMQVRDPNVIMARGRERATILQALQRALARQQRDGTENRIFIVRTHMSVGEAKTWSQAFRTLGLRPREVGRGVEPLQVIDPGP